MNLGSVISELGHLTPMQYIFCVIFMLVFVLGVFPAAPHTPFPALAPLSTYASLPEGLGTYCLCPHFGFSMPSVRQWLFLQLLDHTFQSTE